MKKDKVIRLSEEIIDNAQEFHITYAISSRYYRGSPDIIIPGPTDKGRRTVKLDDLLIVPFCQIKLIEVNTMSGNHRNILTVRTICFYDASLFIKMKDGRTLSLYHKQKTIGLFTSQRSFSVLWERLKSA